jgi:guanine nucleotide-binding protein G(i) subunit alpha
MCGKSPEVTELEARSRQISAKIDMDAKELKNEIKILLLGTGESGKSTILKQMTLIYGKGFIN